jgi:hypothetical protein
MPDFPWGATSTANQFWCSVGQALSVFQKCALLATRARRPTRAGFIAPDRERQVQLLRGGPERAVFGLIPSGGVRRKRRPEKPGHQQ